MNFVFTSDKCHREKFEIGGKRQNSTSRLLFYFDSKTSATHFQLSTVSVMIMMMMSTLLLLQLVPGILSLTKLIFHGEINLK